MQEQPKQPQSAELSLKYIAWSLKDIAKALQDILKTLEDIRTDINTTKGNF